MVINIKYSLYSLNIIYIHEKPIALNIYSKDSLGFLSYIIISSYDKDNNFCLPEKIYSKITLFAFFSIFKVF